MKVSDMEDDTITLVQSSDDVAYFNELFQEEFSYYFLTENDYAFGSYGIRLEDTIYNVGEL